eukprot:GILJ01000355.1.p1 GENE.GILJ01000355.1~~GILJ01000355.1.p1  ORF type:complete len:209 (-),score=28.67 GILJ01000355.1:121-747(-)
MAEHHSSDFMAELTTLCKQDPRDLHNGWAFIKHVSGTDVFLKRVETSPIVVVRGEAEVEASAQDVMDFLFDADNFTTIDTMATSIRTVHDHGNRHRVLYASFKLPWPLWGRDFVWDDRNFMKDGVGFAGGQSVSHHDAPEVDGLVRGEILTSGYMAVPVTDHTCKVTYVVQADPKGWLPVAVTNFVATDQASNVIRIRDHFAKKHQKA